MAELDIDILPTRCCLPVRICSVTIYLYDAVYLYLRTVNQTLAEDNSDYRDGRLMRHKTIGQRFTGKNQEKIRYLVHLNKDVNYFVH